MSNLQQYKLSDLTSLLLGMVQHQHIALTLNVDHEQSDVLSTSDYDAVVYSDGGSRGNPGPSAAGFVILDGHQEVIEQGGEYLGITTNSQAEYHGVRLGLERASELGLKRIDFRIDSMMVVNQMNGVFVIKNRELWPIHQRIRQLMQNFERVHFSHVKREFNVLADGMVNKTLDAHARHKIKP